MTALTKNVSPSFSKMYGTMEGRIAFQQEAKRRELRKRQHLACAIAEEGRRRASTEEERRYAKRPRTDVSATEYAKAHAKMERERANVKKAEDALTREEEKERAKERAKEKKKERDRTRAREKRATSNHILSLSDDDMMTAVLQSLGCPRTIGVDLLSVYTLWLFTATKSYKNRRPMNRLALMKAFAVEYFSLARRGDNPPPSLTERD